MKYPFAGLAVKVGADIELSEEDPERQEIIAKNEKQLEGIWQSLEREAKQVLQQVIASEAAKPSQAEEPPLVAIEAALV